MDLEHWGQNESAEPRPCETTLNQFDLRSTSRSPYTAACTLQDGDQSTSPALEHSRSSENELAPITRLPPEVLIQIFLALRDRPRSHWETVANLIAKRPRTLRLGWILVSHVCRRWRNTAVRCPSLWTKVTFSLGLRWARCMLMRTQESSFSIHAPMTLSLFATACARTINDYVERTHTLDLSASWATMPSVLEYLVGPALSLHTLVLSVDEASFPWVADPVAVPANIFGNRVPKLQHLTLRSVSTSWPSTLFNDLHTLFIGYPRLGNGGRRPDYVSFLHLLKGMPKLRLLSLLNCLPDIPQEAAVMEPQIRSVSLPSLADLHLDDDIRRILPIMNAVKLPSSGNTIRLEAHTWDPGAEVFPDDFRALACHLVSGGELPIPFHDVTISAGDPNEALRIAGIIKYEDGREHRAEFIFTTYPASVQDVLHSFFSSIDLRAIETLEFGAGSFDMLWPSESHWPAGYPSLLPALAIKTLCIDSQGAKHTFTFLGCSISDSVPFPDLNRLKIRDMRGPLEQEVQELLVEVLCARNDRGAQLQILILDQCSADAVDDEWLHVLENIVPDVLVLYSGRNMGVRAKHADSGQ